MTTISSALATGSTREQILGVARHLIQTRSYLGFSFQDVADQVGIRKASLYHHFATKETLGIEVLREATEGFRTWTAARARSPQDALVSYFRMLRNNLHAGQGLCPAGAVTTGWDCINEELRDAVRELRGVQVSWLTEVLSQLPAAHAHGKPFDAHARAAYVFAVCQGALMAARMTGSVEDYDAAVLQLQASLAP